MARSSPATDTAAAEKLAKYRAMRDFGQTPEPSGESERDRPGRSFVIQQHAARRLHYDFRLEHEGVLWSWSVPKGPSLSPSERRLAVRTEDHPMSYADFEGVIPPGQYGSGTVVVWDQGSWEPEGDPTEAMKKGRITFTLAGAKLRGRWHLVRTRGTDKQESWLLFKSKDEAASTTGDIVAERPESVLSGRTLDEIAAAPARTWQSNRAGGDTSGERTKVEVPAAAVAPPGEDGAPAPNVLGLVAQLPLGFALTSLDKVLYPEQGLSKGELIAYLAVVAEHMLPHVANRPLTLVRCPEGRGKPCFFQKHILPGAPAPIRRVPLEETAGEIVEYMAVSDMPGLVALAQLGTLEIHTWGSHTDDPERPDLMVIDLDPDEGLPWDRVALAAFELRGRLRALGLDSFVKTTGGKGLHVCVPVARDLGWDDFKAFSKAVVEAMERDAPDQYTTNMAKAQRRGKVFLDYLRNGRNATFIAPFSPRSRPNAPVAVPISWEELAEGVDPAAWTVRTVPKRLGALEADPWAGIGAVDQAITADMWRALGAEPPATAHLKPAAKAHRKPAPRAHAKPAVRAKPAAKAHRKPAPRTRAKPVARSAAKPAAKATARRRARP